ncbi:MAG TPA: SGNH/GDSL hydrolase family protein [Actinomycetota bacterium]|nr:SGNH/GDSL hydrolase family protein [Actinomycetota bacterium]
MRLPRAALVVALIATAAAAEACSSVSSPPPGPPAQPNGPAPLYVAVGASETVGVGVADPYRQAWPALFFREALPPSARFVDLGVPGVTVSDALVQEAPAAVSLHPDVVTVWLNVNDLIAGVSAATYGQELTGLLQELRRGGRTQVLVANTPPVQAFPAYRSCLPFMPGVAGCNTGRRAPTPDEVAAMVAAYNAAILSAARATGSHVVDLYAAAEKRVRAGTFAALIGPDNFHPDAQGYRVVAALFARAYRSLPSSG